jgi:hypothetical protein
MGRPKWTKEVVARVTEKSGGLCHHCRKPVDLANRSEWHIDHYPVLYKDIEDQICCGVTDARDVGNLVLACRACNTSHRYELTPYCHGRYSQYPCKRAWAVRCGVFAAGACAGAATTLLLTLGLGA